MINLCNLINKKPITNPFEIITVNKIFLPVLANYQHKSTFPVPEPTHQLSVIKFRVNDFKSAILEETTDFCPEVYTVFHSCQSYTIGVTATRDPHNYGK